jgi:hypothetical protein
LRTALIGERVAAIRCEGDRIVSERTGRAPASCKAEVTDGAPRGLRDAKGAMAAFADRREGEDVVWRRIG